MLPVSKLPDLSNQANPSSAHHGKARSNNLERDSSSSWFFQNWNWWSKPSGIEPSEFEGERSDYGWPSQGSKNWIEEPYNKVAKPVKLESKDSRGLHFKDKLKLSDVPQWDGNLDTIILWLSKINNLAWYSKKIHDQLGSVVPRRLDIVVENWYWSLPLSYRNQIEVSWMTLKAAVSCYYMNWKWLDKQKGRAMCAYYWEPGHNRETPSKYYICKSKLLNTVYNLEDSELILEVMEGAPASWNTILTTQLYIDTIEFQEAVWFHEDNLIWMSAEVTFRKELYEQDYQFQNKDTYTPQAWVHLVGEFKGQELPKFPKDDANISKWGKTPEEKGAWPCHHCGNGKHWDYECWHSFKGNRAARANLSQISAEGTIAQNKYDDLYYSLDSDSETKQDFHNPLQNYTSDCLHIASCNTEDNFEAPLEEKKVERDRFTLIEQDRGMHYTPPSSIKPSLNLVKPPLNWRTCRWLAKEILCMTLVAEGRKEGNHDKGSMIELKWHVSRLPGCLFLGSEATHTMVTVKHSLWTSHIAEAKREGGGKNGWSI